MIENINKVYFLGAGGIGMSSVARFFLQKGIHVAGYDRTSTLLTRQLEMEGMIIHYDDDPVLIPEDFKEPEETLVIYTPALPETHSEYNFFRNNGFRLAKRSVVLGEITSAGKCVAVAGTHGKTTISGMIAHILHESGFGCNAFLGGISVKHNSNYIFNPQSDYYVVEADEYDRSFLTLSPKIALITAMDPDHLDVYNNVENMRSAFSRFAYQVDEDGVLILKKGVSLIEPGGKKILRYSMSEPADYYAYNIQREDLTYSFSLGTPLGVFHQVKTGILGKINVENTVAAIAVAFEAGVNPAQAVNLAKTYRGIKRRFEVLIHKKHLVYIDDYAHHPEELRALKSSVREIIKDKRISGVFQPHL